MDDLERRPTGLGSLHADLESSLDKRILQDIENFDENAIPPSLSFAVLHGKCSMFGMPLDRKQSDVIKICPCCCNIENEQYPMCTPTDKITNYGPVIPMFFQFSKFLIGMAVLFSLAGTVGQYYIIRSNCTNKAKFKYNRCGYNLTTLIDASLRDSRATFQNFSQYINLGVLVVSILSFYWMHRKQLRLADSIDSGMVSPADYTVMMQDIGPKEENTQYIADFVDSLVIKAKIDPVHIVKVNFGKFSGNINRIERDRDACQASIEALQKIAAEQSLNEEKKVALNKKIAEYESKHQDLVKKLQRYKDRLANEPSFSENNIAFITFQTQEQAEAISVLQNRRRELQRAVTKLFICCSKKKVHKINRAVEPDDIKWKFIGFSAIQRSKTIIISYLITIFIIVGSFFIQLLIKHVQKSYIATMEEEKTWTNSLFVQVCQIGASVAISMINRLLASITLRLSRYEKHLTTSDFLVSHTRKLIIFQFMNTAGIAVVLFMLPADYGGIESLNLFVFYQLLFNLLLGAINQACDPVYIIKVVRRYVNTNKLNSGQFCPLTQLELNEVFEAPDIALFFRYGNIIRTFFVAMFFSYILPIGPVLCLAFLCLQFWVDKYMTIRRYKEIVRLNKELSHRLNEYCEIGLVLYCIGNIIFRRSQYKTFSYIDFLSLAITVLLVIWPVFEFAKKHHLNDIKANGVHEARTSAMGTTKNNRSR